MFCDLAVRPPSRPGSTRRTCAKSSARTTAAAPISSPKPAGLSPGTWATGCWSISAIRTPTSMMPNGPSGPGFRWSRRCRNSRPPPACLQVRVGIATGLVVVGDLIGTGAARSRGWSASTPNLAARLQALAEPGTVVISSSTRRLTGGLFDYRDLGAVALKGFAETRRRPGRCWARAPPKAGSRRCARARRRWSARQRKSICCCAVGSRRRPERARSSCSRASPASASRGSPRPSSSG